MTLTYLNDLFGPFEKSISQENYSTISSEYKRITKDFGSGSSVLASCISKHVEQFPEVARFYPRLQQINSIKKWDWNLSLKEKICLALFIHKVFDGQKRISDKSSEESCPVPHLPSSLLQWTVTEQSFYGVVKKDKKPSFDDSNTQEEIIQIPEDSSIAPRLGSDALVFTYISKQLKTPLSSLQERIVQLRQINLFAYNKNFITICLFIEIVILPQKFIEATYFKKASNEETQDLKHSMLYSPKTASTYLFLKRHGELNEIAGSKKVTNAIQIPDNKTAPITLIAQAVNRKDRCYKKFFIESELYRNFSENKGIWPLLDTVQYQQIRKNIPGSYKTSLFSPVGTPTEQIITTNLVLTLDQHLEMAEHIVAGVLYLHSTGYLHGDLHPGNILFKILPNSRVVAGLIDFGLSFLVSKGPKSYLLDGFYGVIVPSAPELFGTPNFTGDLYKVEIWALGFLLYALFMKRELPWAHTLNKQWKEHKSAPVQQEVKEQIIEKMRNYIDPRQKSFMIQKNRSPKEDYMLLIYDMLAIDPTKRPNALEITQRIAEIQANCLAEKIKTSLHL